LLDFVYSLKKREELENILNSRHPGHSSRLYLCGFLNYCGLSGKDILKLIQHHSRWIDFDVVEATKHINSICKDFPASSFSEDLSFVNHKDDLPQYRRCDDTSIFRKLNASFFNIAERTAWEYDVGKYNLYGQMSWNVIKHPVYRSIEDKNGLLLYLDLDCNDISYGWDVAKRLYDLDTWTTFKYSGSRGFHLCKLVKTNYYADLKEQAEDFYRSVKTNLISFGRDKNSDKPVNIDTSSFNRKRLVRGYCLNLKGNKYSIPVDTNQKIDEILDISSSIDKIKTYLSDNYK